MPADQGGGGCGRDGPAGRTGWTAAPGCRRVRSDCGACRLAY